MKRIIFFLCSITILLCSCNNNTRTSFTFEYSNIVDNETQEFVTNLLNQNGIDENDIDKFIACVNGFYNDYENIVNNGWRTIELKNFGYDDTSAYKHWDSKERDRLDINCRFITYWLIKDFITFNGGAFAKDNIKDISLLLENTFITLSDEDIFKYAALYGDVEADNVDENSLSEAIILQRQKYGIEFNDNSEIKLLCLYTQSEAQNIAQIIHAAVVIRENDNYYLIEKYDPMYPYQISKFESKENLISYILNRCSAEKTVGLQNVVLMINNEYFN